MVRYATMKTPTLMIPIIALMVIVRYVLVNYDTLSDIAHQNKIINLCDFRNSHVKT
jgi:hypothetical protein